MTGPEGSEAVVTVYQRPGCPYCTMLRRGLKRAGVPTVEIDIWKDAEAAAYVRSHAGGNETVPTVVVADSVLVNPPARTVVALAVEAGVVTVPVRRWFRPAKT